MPVVTSENPLKILVVSQYFWPENFRINDLVSEFVARGHSVTILTGKPNYPEGLFFPDYVKSPGEFNSYEGADIFRVPHTPRRKGSINLLLNYITFAVSAAVLGPWKLRRKKFDVIFTFEPSPITVGIPASVLRWFKKAPMAFWVLDLWPETLEALGILRSKFLLRLVGRLVSVIYRNCDLILAQSQSFIPQIAKYTDNVEKIKYFPSWSDTQVGLDGVVPAAEFSPSPNSFNILFAGNIGDAQDFPAVLRAANALKEHKAICWLIVGDGRLASWVKDEIKRLDLMSTVKMLGRYPVERMPSFYAHADALLVSLQDKPIFAMTIPGKVQSYLATGRPIVAMLNGEGGDVISRAGAGYVCPAGDSNGLADAILKLSSLPVEDRRLMGNKGLGITREEFDRNQLISKLEYWFRELIKNAN